MIGVSQCTRPSSTNCAKTKEVNAFEQDPIPKIVFAVTGAYEVILRHPNPFANSIFSPTITPTAAPGTAKSCKASSISWVSSVI